MNIDTKFSPWTVCSMDAYRLALSHVYYDHDKHVLKATNGKAMIFVSVTGDEDDESGLIPVEALKAAVKLAGKKQSCYVLGLKAKTVRLTDGRTWPVPDLTFPNCEQAIPDARKWVRHARLSFDPSLLAAIVKAYEEHERGSQVVARQIIAAVYNKAMDAGLL